MPLNDIIIKKVCFYNVFAINIIVI